MSETPVIQEETYNAVVAERDALLDENARLRAMMAKAHATMIATGWREAFMHDGADIVAMAATEIEGEFARAGLSP